MRNTTQCTLADAIRLIHEELVEAQTRREVDGLLPLLQVKGVEIELSVMLAEQTSKEGGSDIKVFAAKFGDKVDQNTTHKIKLVLDVHPDAVNQGLPGFLPNTPK